VSYPNDYRTPYVSGPTSPGPTSTGPLYGPQTYIPSQYGPPTGFPVPPKKKSRAGLIAGLVGAGVALLCGIGIVAVALGGDPAKSPAVSQPATGAPTTAETTAAAEPTKPSTFKLPVGTSVTQTSNDGVATIAVTKIATSKSGCKGSQLKSQKGTYVIVDVRIEIVSGTASVNPLLWEFVGSDGTTENAMGGIFAGCQNLGSGNDIPPGLRKGQVVFDVASPAGEITYNEVGGGPVASWVVG